MSQRSVYHVVPTEKGWSLQPEGQRDDWQYYATKEEAISEGSREAAAEGLAQLIIHKSDGTIEEERTYGDDPQRSPG